MRTITRRRALGLFVSAAGAAGMASLGGAEMLYAEEENILSVNARLIALGIPGASAISPVGTFLPGGPIHDNPALAAFTRPGRVLDPARILVGSRSNFGAPKANADQQAGALLSIDVNEPAALDVPADFAGSGDQASVLGGAVQMYSAQSANWLNGVYNPSAVTAHQAGVSNPLGLSINNAFGRVWPANAPYGLRGAGSSSIDDPDGRPLKGAPNTRTGGVYFGDLTGRQPAQVIPGALNRGAVGTAFLGHSPDGSTRAVFCVVVADGSIVQEHTARALDGLAPAGTVQPLLGRAGRGDAGEDDQGDDRSGGGLTPRLGAILNYKPAMVLYVSQPFDDSIKVIDLAVGGPAGSEIFVPTTSRVIRSAALNHPVDLAPVRIETEDRNWASNTTMEEAGDFYVCNRGDGTVIRMRQDGTVVAARRIRFDGRSLGRARLNGISSSPDHSRVWLTYVGKLPGKSDPHGGVLELPAF